MAEEERKAAKVPATRESALRRLPWAAPFIVLALVVAFDRLTSDQAWPVAALVLIGIVILIVPADYWRTLIDRIEAAELGPISLGLRRDAADAATYVPPSDKGEGVDEPTDDARTVFELRMRLEWKLAYVAKHLLASDGAATFVNIGSLEFDGLLSPAEARTATGILTMRDEELRELPDGERSRFLSEAQKFVDSVRATVFWGQVRRVLDGSADGGADLVRRELPANGGRRDFLAGPEGREFRVAPALALLPDSQILRLALDRLAEEGGPSRAPEHQIVVVPDVSRVVPDPAGRQKIVKLSSLRATLGAA